MKNSRYEADKGLERHSIKSGKRTRLKMEKQAINTDFPSGLRKLILYHNKKTGKPVLWSKPVDSTYLDIWGAEEIAGGGYYWIAHKDWSGYSFSPGELLKLERLEAEARGKPSTFYVARLAFVTQLCLRNIDPRSHHDINVQPMSNYHSGITCY